MLKVTATHTLSPLQLVAGKDKRIHHGINMARNAIFAAGKPRHPGCGILDTDLVAAFDYLCMEWVYMVLEKKGLERQIIQRIKNLYENSCSIVVVNNVQGKVVKNMRLSLRQGDIPSMYFFSYAVDPLLRYLEKRLNGILICSLPVLGPVLPGQPQLPAEEERYKVIGYADDVKPAITSMAEFSVVDKAMQLFENASGCKLHRNPSSKKCKFLPLARWKGTLQQEDIPCAYMTISDHLDMLGVELRASWTQTRKANGDMVQARVENTIKQWKSGKFMMLNMRGWSINQFCLSKVWFKTHSVDMRVLDITKITSLIKSWLYADLLLKPEEIIMYRPSSIGGLGIHNVKLKALAGLIRTFLETAGNPLFSQSLYHNILFRYHVLDEISIQDPGFPPFYSKDFFLMIRQVHLNSPLNIFHMTEKMWYRLLLEDYCIMEDGDYKKCRVERMIPNIEWERCWALARLPGLGPENISFLFKLLHQILPTQERVARTKPNTSPNCRNALCQDDRDDLQHALIHCQSNDGVGGLLLQCIRGVIPGLEVESLLRLGMNVDTDMQLPIVFLIATVLDAVWSLRVKGNKVQKYMIRSQLEASINLLRETRYRETAIKVEELAVTMFQ